MQDVLFCVWLVCSSFKQIYFLVLCMSVEENMGTCGIQERALEFRDLGLYTADTEPPDVCAGD